MTDLDLGIIETLRSNAGEISKIVLIAIQQDEENQFYTAQFIHQTRGRH